MEIFVDTANIAKIREAFQTGIIDGVTTNPTLIAAGNVEFPLQALLAAKAGADYVAPYIDRVDQIEGDGCQVIADIRVIFNHYAFKTKVLAAAVKSQTQILKVVKSGADAITISPEVFKLMFAHPLIATGLETFLSDWSRVKVNF
jgi:TalC/MipB family fructose-6-phosphate aldolase